MKPAITKILKRTPQELIQNLGSNFFETTSQGNKTTKIKEDEDMTGTGLKFEWNTGSAADNMITFFKDNGIEYHYNKYFQLVADLYGFGTYEKVDYRHLHDRIFEICIA